MLLRREFAALACLLAACGGGDLVIPESEAPAPAAIRVVDGDGQHGSVGEPLAAPVVIEVTDADGDPFEGATVEFALTSAGEGAGITPPTAHTNADGRAQAEVLLGDKVGVQTGEARVAGDGDTAPTATFSALAESVDNRSPAAAFGWSCEELTCRFTETSTDSDGSLTAWSWRFGDGGTSAEREPVHSYDASGTYIVRLTVTDDEGATDELSDEVTVTAASAPPSNQAPRADFEIECRNLTCAFTDRSEDDDGSIVAWLWDFGDGATSSQRNPSHAYESPGRYDVRLTVTDDDGAEAARTRPAEPDEPSSPPPPPPTPAPNDPPVAEFEVDCQELRCTFLDRSRDEDGNVVSWQWDFGDGATSSERNPSHVYGASGRYEVRLLVTDDDGAADTRTRTAEPEAAPPPPPPPPPPEPNDPPDADFGLRCSGLTCTFTDKSKDGDGSVVSWSWSFGDGNTSSERNPVHTYAGSGRFDVLLTVTDDRGGTDTKSRHADPKD
jgi:PKD repeat protein